nr:MAG TPA: hypothetical protein [Caudoviricetes sp.]DAG24375.1 MAG TPA: hypothetical protein [Caudoviricetes sp.]DAV63691.1 MAG TPA: hypothetical protein [Caudoviricetes sp.]
MSGEERSSNLSFIMPKVGTNPLKYSFIIMV